MRGGEEKLGIEAWEKREETSARAPWLVRGFESPREVARALRREPVLWANNASAAKGGKFGGTGFEEVLGAWESGECPEAWAVPNEPLASAVPVSETRAARARMRPRLACVGASACVSAAVVGSPAAMWRPPEVMKARLGHGGTVLVDIMANRTVTSRAISETLMSVARGVYALRLSGLRVGMALGSVTALKSGHALSWFEVLGARTAWDAQGVGLVARVETFRRMVFGLWERLPRKEWETQGHGYCAPLLRAEELGFLPRRWAVCDPRWATGRQAAANAEVALTRWAERLEQGGKGR